MAAGAAGFAGLERLWPYNGGQKLLRGGFWTDLVAYGVIQSWLLGLLIGRLLQAVQTMLGPGRPGFARAWPVAAQVAFFVVTHDAYIYAFHRWQHASPFLWRFHEAHHSASEVDWLSGVRSHPLEILVNQTVEFLPLVLFGASPDVPVIKGAVSAIWGMFIHANLDVRLGSVQYVLNGPEMHRWHHSAEPEARGTNFSTKLAVWDWLLGTAWLPDPAIRKASRYGLGTEGFPAGYFAQVARAFRRDRLA